ncbi:MAG: hypothetical protein O3A63_13170 [Proteobacteria bacterium]|nr:hypothetical protein [Pseudomonadota bacterium]
MDRGDWKKRSLGCWLAVFLYSGAALAEPPAELIKKTLDGRCLAPNHPEYWDTKIYVAKTSMQACIESGGSQTESRQG